MVLQLNSDYNKKGNIELNFRLKEKVDFSIIRYSNCWEDAEILLKGLNPKPNGTFLSIGSAGDNSFSLLTTEPKFIVAVDINPIQLYLIELKKAAFINLDYSEMLDFLGFTDSNKRIILYNKIKTSLSVKCRNYWDSNHNLLLKGIIYCGKFEKYLMLFGKRVLPLLVNSTVKKKLFDAKTSEQQKKLYDNVWNTVKWRLFFKIFFSRFLLGRLGRSPEFLNEVNENVSNYILRKTGNHLSNILSITNEYLHFIINGKFEPQLPHYAREDNFYKIKNNIHRLILHEGYAEDVRKSFSGFDYLNLSNIFEYMNPLIFKHVAGKIIEIANSGAKFAYWNLMVDRRMSDVLPENLEYSKIDSENLCKMDKGFFYKQFIIDFKK